MTCHGRPEISNTNKGSQFTSPRFTEPLISASVKVFSDGCGRCLDSVFIEELWRALKGEGVYLDAFETGTEGRAGIGKWMTCYNPKRPHWALGGRTPEEPQAATTASDWRRNGIRTKPSRAANFVGITTPCRSAG